LFVYRVTFICRPPEVASLTPFRAPVEVTVPPVTPPVVVEIFPDDVTKFPVVVEIFPYAVKKFPAVVEIFPADVIVPDPVVVIESGVVSPPVAVIAPADVIVPDPVVVIETGVVSPPLAVIAPADVIVPDPVVEIFPADVIVPVPVVVIEIGVVSPPLAVIAPVDVIPPVVVVTDATLRAPAVALIASHLLSAADHTTKINSPKDSGRLLKGTPLLLTMVLLPAETTIGLVVFVALM